MTYFIDKYVSADRLPNLQEDLDIRSDRRQCDLIIEFVNRYVNAVIEWERFADRWDMGRRAELADILTELYGVSDDSVIEVERYGADLAKEIMEAEA